MERYKQFKTTNKMKKIIITLIVWYIAIILMEKIDSFPTFLSSLFITIIVSIISLVIWKVIPLCKITNHHVPYLHKGIYYCKYCNKPLNRKL